MDFNQLLIIIRVKIKRFHWFRLFINDSLLGVLIIYNNKLKVFFLIF